MQGIRIVGYSFIISIGFLQDNVLNATSGTGAGKRKGFRQMMQDCREGKVDLIITKSISRFGRNAVDCLVSVRELQALQALGIDVSFEKVNLHSLYSGGKFLLTLIAAMAESESLLMSENIKWGYRRKYETGSIKRLSIGKCLGYWKDEEGQIVIVEKETVIVRRIYQEFLDGLSLTGMALVLKRDGIRADQGNETWNETTRHKGTVDSCPQLPSPLPMSRCMLKQSAKLIPIPCVSALRSRTEGGSMRRPLLLVNEYPYFSPKDAHFRIISSDDCKNIPQK